MIQINLQIVKCLSKNNQQKKNSKALAQKTEPKEKSFYEQILDKTVADTGKGAIKILA
jgi:hypothetical protein